MPCTFEILVRAAPHPEADVLSLSQVMACLRIVCD